MTPVYQECICYTFTVMNERLRIEYDGLAGVIVSEYMPNRGFGDAEIVFYEGKWVWSDDEFSGIGFRDNIYGSDKFRDSILEYIQIHGVPSDIQDKVDSFISKEG